MSPLIKLGIPKGSLENATVELFEQAGWAIRLSSRNYFPSIDDDEISCNLIRSQEMAKYVERGAIDVGIAGRDWVEENEADVVIVDGLVYSKASRRPARWVLVVTQDSPVQRPEDLAGKTISTELVGFTRRYFAERNIPVEVEFSWGATEAKVVEGLCDAIVEVTETGSTIRANNLRIVETLMESTPVIIANKTSWAVPAKRQKIQQLNTLLQAALAAEKMVGLKMNVSNQQLDAVIAMLPSLNKPTVAHLYQSDWVSVESVLHEKEVRRIVPELIKAGAEGIIEYPLNKII
jgi:ATP phosphoribosyltransferase